MDPFLNKNLSEGAQGVWFLISMISQGIGDNQIIETIIEAPELDELIKEKYIKPGFREALKEMYETKLK